MLSATLLDKGDPRASLIADIVRKVRRTQDAERKQSTFLADGRYSMLSDVFPRVVVYRTDERAKIFTSLVINLIKSPLHLARAAIFFIIVLIWSLELGKKRLVRVSENARYARTRPTDLQNPFFCAKRVPK